MLYGRNEKGGIHDSDQHTSLRAFTALGGKWILVVAKD
jgi:hypothetical protein